MGESIEWIGQPAGFAALQEEWELLAAREGHPFSDHGWLRSWWEAFGEDSELRVCTARRNGRLVAALPLAHHGTRLCGLANYHTPIFRPLALDRRALRATLVAALDKGSGDLSLHALPAGDATVSELRLASEARGRPVLIEAAHSSPIIEIAGEFADYERGLGSTLRRRRRKLYREHDVRFRIDDGGEHLESELQRGFEVEASGWKSATGTAILSSPVTTAFYTQVATTYRARGELRLARLEVDGRHVAFNLCLQRRRRLYLLKTGFDQRTGNLAVGLLLNLLVVERCFQDGFEAYELLGDAERWKLQLASAERSHVRVWAYGRRPVPVMRYLARRFALPPMRRIRTRAELHRRTAARGGKPKAATAA